MNIPAVNPQINFWNPVPLPEAHVNSLGFVSRIFVKIGEKADYFVTLSTKKDLIFRDHRMKFTNLSTTAKVVRAALLILAAPISLVGLLFKVIYKKCYVEPYMNSFVTAEDVQNWFFSHFPEDERAAVRKECEAFRFKYKKSDLNLSQAELQAKFYVNVLTQTRFVKQLRTLTRPGENSKMRFLAWEIVTASWAKIFDQEEINKEAFDDSQKLSDDTYLILKGNMQYWSDELIERRKAKLDLLHIEVEIPQRATALAPTATAPTNTFTSVTLNIPGGLI